MEVFQVERVRSQASHHLLLPGMSLTYEQDMNSLTLSEGTPQCWQGDCALGIKRTEQTQNDCVERTPSVPRFDRTFDLLRASRGLAYLVARRWQLLKSQDSKNTQPHQAQHGHETKLGRKKTTNVRMISFPPTRFYIIRLNTQI